MELFDASALDFHFALVALFLFAFFSFCFGHMILNEEYDSIFARICALRREFVARVVRQGTLGQA